MESGLESPVLVGGTGRSGSTIVGHLLDHHPQLTLTRPMEVRFITGNDGIADALAVATRKSETGKAKAAVRLAASRIMERWYERAPDVGLHTSVQRSELMSWCETYVEMSEDDPVGAARWLTRTIMAQVAEKIGATRWVDTTPANARKADRVEAIYPRSHVIVVHRDGRDVAASFVQQEFGPDDVFDALDLWEQRMLRIHRAVQRASTDRVTEIQLVDLVSHSRSETLERICSGIDVPVDATMVAWFDERVTPEGAHHGRWRNDFDADVCARIDESYVAACERLLAAGVSIPAAG